MASVRHKIMRKMQADSFARSVGTPDKLSSSITALGGLAATHLNCRPSTPPNKLSLLTHKDERLGPEDHQDDAKAAPLRFSGVTIEMTRPLASTEEQESVTIVLTIDVIRDTTAAAISSC